MTHPVGYYTGYTPGDSGLLAEIQEIYGARLQELSKIEKMYLISRISTDIVDTAFEAADESPYRSQLFELINKVKSELSQGDQEGLLECLISGVRHQNETR